MDFKPVNFVKIIFKFTAFLAGILIILSCFFYFIFSPSNKIEWGLSFSGNQARYLGLDAKKAYLQILDELKPRHVRLMAYWQNLEVKPGQFDFSAIDFQLTENQKRGIKTVLAVGHKLPRWPECHHPEWYNSLSESEQKQAILNYIQASVEHFKAFSTIEMWQLENEPFFSYGEQGCLPVKRDLLKEEMKLVRATDSRPILFTDSGEKSIWLKTAGMGADAFGSTMYREVYNDKKVKYQKYPIPPAFYRIKAGVIKVFLGYNNVVGSELQAEPWFNGDIGDTVWEDQRIHMNPEIFKDNISYAKRSGFYVHYFWGAEWWLWAKTKGHSEMWDAAKDFFALTSKL